MHHICTCTIELDGTQRTESEFLDEIQKKGLRIFLLPNAIHNHLYIFALRFLFLQTHAPLTVSRGQDNHTETSSLRNLKIMPRNLNEIVRK
jgi:hypothetical protein